MARDRNLGRIWTFSTFFIWRWDGFNFRPAFPYLRKKLIALLRIQPDYFTIRVPFMPSSKCAGIPQTI
jgi:hypothetical protein